jgi:hypothetical protein
MKAIRKVTLHQAVLVGFILTDYTTTQCGSNTSLKAHGVF